ncbi:MAG: PaaI family thioesterase [Alphaproteobacteria bacterium]|nr:PaaI family thioesterase [Alphaproteobacteria bacterium]
MTWATDRLAALAAGATDVPPVVQTLKLGTLDEWGAGWAKKRWSASPEILNGDGTMFGGYIAALADQILTFAAMSVVDDNTAFRTANLSLQFVKLTRGEPLIVEGRVLSQSKQIIAVEAEIRTESGALVAKASGQQIVTRYAAA